MKPSQKIQALMATASDIAMDELMARVERVLERKNPAHHFYMGQGDSYFTDRNGELITTETHGRMLWADQVFKWLEDWDTEFNLTGHTVQRFRTDQ